MMKHVLVLLVCMVLWSCSQQTPEKYESYLNGNTMGTTYNVKYHGGDAPSSDVLHRQINDALIRINQLMSTYIPDSELSRFNQLSAGQPMLLSAETLLVIEEAKRLAILSNGALDVTIGPLVNLWGFGPQKRPEKVPTQRQIDAAKALMGLEHIQINKGIATKQIDGIYVDLSPIAKGYGVDVLAEILESYNIDNYLVEIGGEMRVSGNKQNGSAWRIAIEKPLSEQRAIQKVISIGNNAIATSGDYRNYYEEDGIRYSHLINPTTGRPIQHKLVSVTVVHETSMVADGLATALSILGTEEAKLLAESEDLAVLLITKSDNGFEEYRSPLFDQVVTIH
jgi:thiamine biosynthesis lipoprotein